VLEGSIEFIVGGESRKGGRGFWALAPSAVSHTFGNAGDSPARLLIIHSPAADAYFAELEALWKNSTPTPEAERELMKRHGLEPTET
jgi:quercetin dioxygenase-like cupin family protein